MGYPAFRCPGCNTVHLWKDLREIRKLNPSQVCPDCGASMSNVVMTIVRSEEDDRRDAEIREQVQAEEEPVKAVFDSVAAEAKRLLKHKAAGILGFFNSSPSDVEQSCIADAIDIICRASFRQWRAAKRGKRCPDRFSDEGVSEEIMSIVESRAETAGGSMLNLVSIHWQAVALVQQAHSKMNP